MQEETEWHIHAHVSVVNKCENHPHTDLTLNLQTAQVFKLHKAYIILQDFFQGIIKIILVNLIFKALMIKPLLMKPVAHHLQHAFSHL